MATNTSKIKTNLGELNLAHYTNEDGRDSSSFVAES